MHCDNRTVERQRFNWYNKKNIMEVLVGIIVLYDGRKCI